METFQIRTDLALEARESVNEEESKLRGVSVDEHYEEETDIRITKVTIEMATSKGVYHKNNAARKVSRLSKAVNGMA